MKYKYRIIKTFDGTYRVEFKCKTWVPFGFWSRIGGIFYTMDDAAKYVEASKLRDKEPEVVWEDK